MIATESQLSALISDDAAPRRSPRVLFVDDEPALARLGEKFLERLGCEPVISTNPTGALALFRDGDFDLVITDLTMPELTGIGLGEQCRALRPEVPIIITTAFHTLLEGHDAESLGFAAIIFKPYTLNSLGEVVRRALAGAAG